MITGLICMALVGIFVISMSLHLIYLGYVAMFKS